MDRENPDLWQEAAYLVLIVFMICNVAVSCIALVRYDERGKGVVAENSIQKWADEHYDDVKMEKIYPNAKATE